MSDRTWFDRLPTNAKVVVVLAMLVGLWLVPTLLGLGIWKAVELLS